MSIRLFARLKDITGAGELERDVPEPATARTVWDRLVVEFPDLAGYSGAVSVAVNAEYGRMDSILQDHDEVAFLPPVSGGAPPAGKQD